MQVLVISLAQDSARRENISSQLQQLGVSFEFFDAVDGRLGEHPLLARYHKREFLLNYGRDAQPGELGCYASHFLIWQRCVELNQPIAVLEDDIALYDNFIKGFELAKSLTNELGFIRLEEPDRSSKWQLAGANQGFEFRKFIKMAQRTSGYMISPAVAKAFIDASERFEFPVDVFIRNFHKHQMPLFDISPPILGQNRDEFDSHIGSRKRGQSKGIGLRLQILLRKLANMVGIGLTNLKHLSQLKRIRANWKQAS
ncbi:glycosyltransferase family 25 protein [Paraferrimonas sedimenticola]|uniref:Glycosyl transferase family 25 domain-containing protein n=1 Tax=Paraferrimonas sedimenticola TaxID=375674 RepID=A0AA37RX54_9GAMM|nr:glycosyltransferase family 25 protein [Paraferrimonas sedimenticola]GLP97280.1 hypothetical protein GCM10007895_25870 [Paraferrimonas sedimenticola]